VPQCIGELDNALCETFDRRIILFCSETAIHMKKPFQFSLAFSNHRRTHGWSDHKILSRWSDCDYGHGLETFRVQSAYSRICSSETSKQQLNSPAQIIIPLNHQDLYGDRVKRQKNVLPHQEGRLYIELAHTSNELKLTTIVKYRIPVGTRPENLGHVDVHLLSRDWNRYH
jgi:hypothetical protein